MIIVKEEKIDELLDVFHFSWMVFFIGIHGNSLIITSVI